MVLSSFSVLSSEDGANNPATVTVKTGSDLKKENPDLISRTFTECISSNISKLDKSLKYLLIFDGLNSSYEGFYLKLKDYDYNCTYKKFLEENYNLRITYSPFNFTYLAFSSTIFKEDLNNDSFIEYIYPETLAVPLINESDVIKVHVNLDQNDNVTYVLAQLGTKQGYVYDKPGSLGEILINKGMKISYYDSLMYYSASGNISAVKDIVDLPFVRFIEGSYSGTEAVLIQTTEPPINISLKENGSIKNNSILKKEIEANQENITNISNVTDDEEIEDNLTIKSNLSNNKIDENKKSNFISIIFFKIKNWLEGLFRLK